MGDGACVLAFVHHGGMRAMLEFPRSAGDFSDLPPSEKHGIPVLQKKMCVFMPVKSDKLPGGGHWIKIVLLP
jgi:hypothetical protein